MKRTFEIFTDEEYNAFCNKINMLSRLKKKFNITPWLKSEGVNGGFVVWYYV